MLRTVLGFEVVGWGTAEKFLPDPELRAAIAARRRPNLHAN
jgi:hypothetical protein